MEEIRKGELKAFLEELRANIREHIGTTQFNAPLSKEKIIKFFNGSNEIIKQAFEEFRSVFNTSFSPQDSDLGLLIQGQQNLMAKSAFTNEVEHLNFHTIFAELIAQNHIKYYIPNSFFVARTRRFLLNRENINSGLEKAIASNTNAIIIGLRIQPELQNIVREKHSYISIPYSNFEVQDVFFVLDKSDLPSINFEDLDEKEKEELQLEPLNENLKLYASVIDINTKQNEALKEKIEAKNESTELQVLINIAFKAILRWKKDRDVVQISVTNQYREQGLQNEVGEIKPIKNKISTVD